MEQVFTDMLTRIERQCAKLPDPTENPRDPLSERQPALAALLRNAMLGNKTGGNSGRKALRVPAGQGPLAIKGTGHNCLQANGFSLHANTTVGPLARDALERLCKYLCRPAIAASPETTTEPGPLQIFGAKVDRFAAGDASSAGVGARSFRHLK